jgi:hypothetical protein
MRCAYPDSRSRTAASSSTTAKPSAVDSARAARAMPWPYALAFTTASAFAPFADSRATL